MEHICETGSKVPICHSQAEIVLLARLVASQLLESPACLSTCVSQTSGASLLKQSQHKLLEVSE